AGTGTGAGASCAGPAGAAGPATASTSAGLSEPRSAPAPHSRLTACTGTSEPAITRASRPRANSGRGSPGTFEKRTVIEALPGLERSNIAWASRPPTRHGPDGRCGSWPDGEKFSSLTLSR
ncbi:MAG: hypothetical protein F4041_16845, partial [Acidobacteriia bacterium]|nr:hypothetical protein [Terriglobia bacterium]